MAINEGIAGKVDIGRLLEKKPVVQLIETSPNVREVVIKQIKILLTRHYTRNLNGGKAFGPERAFEVALLESFVSLSAQGIAQERSENLNVIILTDDDYKKALSGLEEEIKSVPESVSYITECIDLAIQRHLKYLFQQKTRISLRYLMSKITREFLIGAISAKNILNWFEEGKIITKRGKLFDEPAYYYSY